MSSSAVRRLRICRIRSHHSIDGRRAPLSIASRYLHSALSHTSPSITQPCRLPCLPSLHCPASVRFITSYRAGPSSSPSTATATPLFIRFFQTSRPRQLKSDMRAFCQAAASTALRMADALCCCRCAVLSFEQWPTATRSSTPTPKSQHTQPHTAPRAVADSTVVTLHTLTVAVTASVTCCSTCRSAVST